MKSSASEPGLSLQQFVFGSEIILFEFHLSELWMKESINKEPSQLHVCILSNFAT